MDILIVSLSSAVLALLGGVAGYRAYRRIRKHGGRIPGEAMAMIGYWANLMLLLAAFLANSQEAKTVIGPANPDLAAGAEALLAGDAERGVALTLAGLKLETRARDRVAGLSNLCAGYIMLERHRTALEYCDLALEENERASPGFIS